MPESSAAAQPGVVPAILATAGTMVAALYGDMAPRRSSGADAEHDAYSLFHQRSIAMGWLDDRSAGGGAEDRLRRAPGLWAMNDAGWDHPLVAPAAHLVSWFQVEASAVADDRPLPVRPFLRCAQDATTWAGTADLSAVQVLLPVQGIDAARRPPYAPVPAMLSGDWFAGRHPRPGAVVTVTVNSGRDSSVPAVGPDLVRHVVRLAENAFACVSHDVDGPDAGLPPPFDDGLWNGPPGHGVVLRGQLAEWSCDAIGWLAEVVADSAARLGVRVPVLFTVARGVPAG